MTTIPVAARRIEPPFPDRLEIVGWDDPVVNAVGFPPHHPYVEMLWLPILGPSTTWLYRRLHIDAEHGPVSSTCPSSPPRSDSARRPARTRRSRRTLHRLVRFGLAARHGNQLAVRTTAPPLSQRQLDRLTPPASRPPTPSPPPAPRRRRRRHARPPTTTIGVVALRTIGPTLIELPFTVAPGTTPWAASIWPAGDRMGPPTVGATTRPGAAGPSRPVAPMAPIIELGAAARRHPPTARPNPHRLVRRRHRPRPPLAHLHQPVHDTRRGRSTTHATSPITTADTSSSATAPTDDTSTADDMTDPRPHRRRRRTLHPQHRRRRHQPGSGRRRAMPSRLLPLPVPPTRAPGRRPPPLPVRHLLANPRRRRRHRRPPAPTAGRLDNARRLRLARQTRPRRLPRTPRWRPTSPDRCSGADVADRRRGTSATRLVE